MNKIITFFFVAFSFGLTDLATSQQSKENKGREEAKRQAEKSQEQHVKQMKDLEDAKKRASEKGGILITNWEIDRPWFQLVGVSLCRKVLGG